MSEFDELRAEYESRLVGEKIYARVRKLIRDLLRRRDPRIYAQGAYSLEDGLDDVVNDFFRDVLLKKNDPQIVYVMETATSLTAVDRLLNRQARRFLARTRTRTVIDNLIDRAREVLRSGPFEVVAGSGSSETYGLIGKQYEDSGSAAEDEIRRAATLARAIPKASSESAEERAPKVYDADGLSAVLRILVDCVSRPIQLSDLQRFFSDLLTAWTPSLLGLPDDRDADEPAASAEERALVIANAHELVTAMSPEERIIFLYKHAGVADRHLANRLGLSRQSVDPRKRALFDRLRNDLGELPTRLQAAVLRQVTIELAALGIEEP